MENENFNGREAMELTRLFKVRAFCEIKFIEAEFKEGNFVFVDETRDCYRVYNGSLVKYLPYYDKDNW